MPWRLITARFRWEDSGWHVQESDLRGRRDMRGARAMSVDPPGCQDIDDAMHVRRKPDGKLEVRKQLQTMRS